MTLDMRRENILSLVNAEKGLVDRRIYADDDIYQAELEQIFARAWNFMAHESQIPNPGDFFQTYIGEDRVIVVRDKSGQPQVLLTGFLDKDENAQGRPAGVAIDSRGGVLIADDAGDAIWRVTGTMPVVASSARANDVPTLAQRYQSQLQPLGPRASQCVDVNESPNASSGSFQVAGFGMYASTGQQKQGNLSFKPATPEPGARLTVTAQNLDRPGTASVYYASLGEHAVYPVKMQLPDRGTWLITTEAGKSFGCFLYTLR